MLLQISALSHNSHARIANMI